MLPCFSRESSLYSIAGGACFAEFYALFETLNGRIGETASFTVWAEKFPGVWLLGYDRPLYSWPNRNPSATVRGKSCSAQRGNQDFSSNIGRKQLTHFQFVRSQLCNSHLDFSQFSSGFLPILIWISQNPGSLQFPLQPFFSLVERTQKAWAHDRMACRNPIERGHEGFNIQTVPGFFSWTWVKCPPRWVGGRYANRGNFCRRCAVKSSFEALLLLANKIGIYNNINYVGSSDISTEWRVFMVNYNNEV